MIVYRCPGAMPDLLLPLSHSVRPGRRPGDYNDPDAVGISHDSVERRHERNRLASRRRQAASMMPPFGNALPQQWRE